MLVGLGDSVTDGFGASRGRAYFDQLERSLHPLEAHNYAVSGSTSQDCLERQLPRVPTFQQPACVVITTGGNDLIHHYGRTPPNPQGMYGATWSQAQPWIDAFQPRLDMLLDGIQQRCPAGCRIFLANVYDPTDGIGDIESAGLPAWPDGLKILAAYNDTLQRVADRRPGVELVDLHGAFLGHGIHHRDDYWFYDNLEDPNDAGYDAISRLFLEAMR